MTKKSSQSIISKELKGLLDGLIGEQVDLELKTHPFKAIDTDKRVKEFYLQELSGKERDEYLQEWAEVFMDTKEDGTSVVNKKHKGLYSMLLKRTVFTKDGDLVPEETIQSWPSASQFKLWQASQLLSGLNKKKAEAEVKND